MSKHTINLFDLTGRTPFVADGDTGLRLRREVVMPLLADGASEVVIECQGIENMTDSFANAFFGPLCVDFAPGKRVFFKGCTELTKSFITSAWQIELRRRENNVDRK
jgi:hypothetical protein